MSVILPRAVAVFETELAQSITDSDTIMYLSSALTKDGDELEADKWYGFVIEQGTLNEEFVIGQVDSSNRKMIKNLKRGISYKDGQTEITSLKKNHSRGASVRITDAPILPAIVDAFNDAVENFNNAIENFNDAVENFNDANQNFNNVSNQIITSINEAVWQEVNSDYTISQNNFGKLLKVVGNQDITITIPTDTNLGITDSSKMYKFFILKSNGGLISIQGQSGVNILFVVPLTFLNRQNNLILVLKNGQNSWIIY